MSRTTARAAVMQMIFEHMAGGEETIQMVHEALHKTVFPEVDSISENEPGKAEWAYITKALDSVLARLMLQTAYETLHEEEISDVDSIEPEQAYITKVIDGVLTHFDELDAEVQAATVLYKATKNENKQLETVAADDTDQITAPDLAILQMTAWEILYYSNGEQKEVEVDKALKETVRYYKKKFDYKRAAFIKGVLIGIMRRKNTARTAARTAAMQMIFEHMAGGEGGEDTLQTVYEILRKDEIPEVKGISKYQPNEKNREYITTLLDGVLAHLDELDEAIQAASPRWEISRMPHVDLTILRMAAWEILYEEGIPGPVAINEAVNLANRFSEPTSGRFVNGVLGTILRRKQAENP